MDGWIKLHRKIRENPIFSDMHLFRLWIICLAEATHRERDQLVGRQMVHLMPGEFVTGRFDLQDMFNRGLKPDQQKSPKTIWRWLETLENHDYLTIKATNKFSVVAIVNWDKYQSCDQQIDQQVTNKRPTSDQQVTTNKNVKKEKNEIQKDPRPKSNRIYDEDSIPYRSAKYLLTNILLFKPDLKQPNLQSWADDMRKLIELDGRDPREVAKVIEWVTKDSFWQSNVLSASTLRSQWDKLTAKMKQSPRQGKTVIHLPTVQVTDEERAHLAEINRKQAERNGVSFANSE